MYFRSVLPDSVDCIYHIYLPSHRYIGISLSIHLSNLCHIIMETMGEVMRSKCFVKQIETSIY